MTVHWDGFLKILIIYSTLPINIIHILLYFKPKKGRPVHLALGFMLIFLPLVPMSIIEWPLAAEWKWPVMAVSYMLFNSVVFHLFILEGSFSSILFGTLWVGSFSHLIMALLYVGLFSGMGLEANWKSYHLVRIIYACLCLGLFPLFITMCGPISFGS